MLLTKRQYLLTCKVSRYCILAVHGSMKGTNSHRVASFIRFMPSKFCQTQQGIPRATEVTFVYCLNSKQKKFLSCNNWFVFSVFFSKASITL